MTTPFVRKSEINGKPLNFFGSNWYDINGIPLEENVMTVSEAVVARLVELCEERHITINKVSVISGVTQSTINDVVHGTTASTKIGTIKKLCDGLEISVRQFFDSPLFDDLEQEIK